MALYSYMQCTSARPFIVHHAQECRQTEQQPPPILSRNCSFCFLSGLVSVALTSTSDDFHACMMIQHAQYGFHGMKCIVNEMHLEISNNYACFIYQSTGMHLNIKVLGKAKLPPFIQYAYSMVLESTDQLLPLACIAVLKIFFASF